MRAIVIDAPGQRPTQREVPMPTPGDGEVRVRVQASSLNACDLRVLEGSPGARVEHRFPVVLGKDFSGVVDAVGPGADGFAEGDQVFGVVTKACDGAGAFAEYVTVPAGTGIVRRPEAAPARDVGSLGLAGVAAFSTIEALALARGQTVLVAGAPGGVGSFAVQLGAAHGARVIATAATRRESEHVRRLGACETVDPAAVVEAVRALAPGGVDAVAHVAGDAEALARLVRRGGRFASTRGIGPEQLRDLPVVATRISAVPTAGVLARLAASLAEGRLQVPISRAYALERVPAALAEFGRRGKVGKFAVVISQ